MFMEQVKAILLHINQAGLVFSSDAAFYVPDLISEPNPRWCAFVWSLQNSFFVVRTSFVTNKLFVDIVGMRAQVIDMDYMNHSNY